MEFGQILVCCMTNIYNMFLAQCWRLETSFRPIFNCPLFTFFKKSKKKWNTGIFWHNWFLRYWSRLLNWERPGGKLSLRKLFNFPLDKGLLHFWDKNFLTKVYRNIQLSAFLGSHKCSSWTSRNDAVQITQNKKNFMILTNIKLTHVAYKKRKYQNI